MQSGVLVISLILVIGLVSSAFASVETQVLVSGTSDVEFHSLDLKVTQNSDGTLNYVSD